MTVGNNLKIDMNPYFSGKRLWGNEFDEKQIKEWFSDEAEGYFNLSHQEGSVYSYGYHALNKKHGYALLPDRNFSHVLGLGAAHGAEFEPILSRAERATILEPSDGYASTTLNGVPIEYEKPHWSGVMPLVSNSVDLITCLGVLHHIPNVEKVVSEIYRVLMPGGYVLLREPIHTMGDWRTPRPGLTKRERGIPLNLLRRFVKDSGFDIVSERACVFSLTSRLRFIFPGSLYNNSFVVALDWLICSLPLWSKAYHANSFIEKLRPQSVYFVLHKPSHVQ